MVKKSLKKLFNDSKWKKMALSCSEKTINIIKRENGVKYGVKYGNNGDFYCLNCLHSFRTKDKLKSQHVM